MIKAKVFAKVEKCSYGQLSRHGPCKILIKFRHGLGDNVQLLIPLQHIAQQRPEWTVDLVVLPRREDVFYKACNQVFNYHRPPLEDKYDWVYENDTIRHPQLGQTIWSMQLPNFVMPDFPQSWPLHFLIHEVHLMPKQDLFYCNINIQKRYEDVADKFINWDKFVVIHANGVTNQFLSYFKDKQIVAICDLAVEKGYVPVLLDYENISRIPNNQTIMRAQIPKESGVLAAFLQKARLFVGIDSGPLHVAGATGINCVGLWELTSPQYLYAFNQNVVHYHPNGFGNICNRFRTTNDYMKSIEELL